MKAAVLEKLKRPLVIHTLEVEIKLWSSSCEVI